MDKAGTLRADPASPAITVSLDTGCDTMIADRTLLGWFWVNAINIRVTLGVRVVLGEWLQPRPLAGMSAGLKDTPLI